MAFPACVATIVHVPPASSDAVVPETVHTAGVLEANVTASPELAVADNPSDDCAYSVPVIAGKLTVCAVLAMTVKLCETGVAAP